MYGSLLFFTFKVDLDFATDSHNIEARWGGFQDSQSGIHYYKVGVGTEPGLTDALPFEDVGSVTGITN